MTQDRPVSSYIDLNLTSELKDKEFREAFFRAELEIDIPRQIKLLRKLRGLTQEQLASLAKTKQSAISRLERADYGRWGMETLLNLAEALDGRLSVTIEPYEDVIARHIDGVPESTSAVNDVSRPEQRGPGRVLSDETRETQGDSPSHQGANLRSIAGPEDKSSATR